MTLLVIGLSFLSSGNNVDKNISKSSVKKIQNDEYRSQFKRRNFIRERREKERKEINSQRNARKDDTRSRYDDFTVYNRFDDSRTNYDDFR